MVTEEGQVEGGRGSTGKLGFFINFPADLMEKIEKYAAVDERTARGQVQYIVRQWVRQMEDQERSSMQSDNGYTSQAAEPGSY